MAGNKRVCCAFIRLRKTGDSSELPQGTEGFPAPVQDFMGIALVPDIEQNSVFGCVINPVQRNGQFHRAEVGCQMTAGFGNRIDQQGADLRTEFIQLRIGQISEICRRMDCF